MEYECVILYSDGKEHTEKIDVPSDTDPTQHIKEIIKNFNDEEKRRHKENKKYPIDIRKFVRLLNETGVIICELEKYNQCTVIKNGTNYDIMKCKKCKMFYQRFGFGSEFYGSNFICDENRNCLECNRQFKTEKYCINHNQKGKHKTPDWLPDGV